MSYFLGDHSFLACLIRRKSQGIVITRLSSKLLCKNFNVAHYSKSIKDVNTKLGILAHHDKMQLQLYMASPGQYNTIQFIRFKHSIIH